MSKTVYILTSNLELTRFMRDADLHEKTRVIQNPLLEADVVSNFGKKNVKAILKHCETKNVGLVAIWDAAKIYYRDPNVQTVSDGSKWFVLDDVLPKT